MRLDELSIYCLRIPFVQAFRHATKDRQESDAIIVEVRAEGSAGHGEALPRDYVTGETEDSVVHALTRHTWPRLAGRILELPDEGTLAALGQHLDPIFADAPVGAGILAHSSARCALELALVDLWLKLRQRPLAELLPQRVQRVAYSGVITSGSADRAAALAQKLVLGGLQQIKLKVGDALDLERVRQVRRVVGERSLRVDANGAWTLEQARERLAALAELGVESCEEPLGRERRAQLPELAATSPIPIVVDESLVTAADARQLLEERACQGFNLRLNKLGGLWPCLELAREATAQGVWCQLGSHVGETSVLAAAGRQLALHLGNLRFVEGSFGSLLLGQDVASPSIKFGHGGWGSALSGPGLGAHVLPERLVALATRRWSSR